MFVILCVGGELGGKGVKGGKEGEGVSGGEGCTAL